MEKYKIIEEKHIFKTDFKLKWLGYGEWVEEADHVHIEYSGYSAIISRLLKEEPFSKEEHWFGGHLCGYVKIPHDHPYYGKKYYDIEIECHGCLTYSESHEEHWIGFDCAHSGDYCPSMELYMREKRAAGELPPLPKGLEHFHLFNPVYRNIQYVIDECCKIIDQLSDIKFETMVKAAAQASENELMEKNHEPVDDKPV